MKENTKISNLREVEKVFMISVLEGNGTTEFPFEIIRYVVTLDGSILGKVNQDWMEIKPLIPHHDENK